jgi:hypothetical protein
MSPGNKVKRVWTTRRKFDTINNIRTLSIAAVVAGLLFAPGPISSTEPLAGTGQTLRLEAPPFVRTAYAQENPTAFDLGAYLDQEAGISAYYKSPDAITLSQVRGQFRTIETETADYIIGSVAVPNHPENFDAHVYVHTTGWILAYYLRADPVSKIVDVYNSTIDTTKLKTVVSIIASAAGAPFTDVTYYDFRYPNATNMLFVAEDIADGHDFTIKMPSAYGYFERGWALHNFSGGSAYFLLDGVDLSEVWGGNSMFYGTITASSLLPDIQHAILVDDYGVLVLIYRVP